MPTKMPIRIFLILGENLSFNKKSVIERFKEIVDITEDENKLLMDETTKNLI